MLKTIKIGVILLLVVSLALSFSAGCTLATNAPPTTNQGLDTVQEAWGIISREYVEKDKVDTSNMSQAAIKGMVQALNDPYTSYLDPQHYQMSLSDIQGKFEGIGAYVGIREKQIVIIAPVADSPAAKAGIKAGDIILAIDDNVTSGMSLEVAVLNIRGPKGTLVRLLIQHQGETEPVNIEIVRAEIKVPGVHFEMKEDIAYIRIDSFSEQTNQELSPVLETITRGKATGIVLDLRSNPGGLLEAVVDVASHFLKEGVVLYVVDNQGQRTSISVKPQKVTTDLPMVIVTDNFSASASEVLTGAMQDYGRATIAGTKTFGKGSVNTLHRLKDGSGLYITIARWLTPKGRLIEGKGIEPDYPIELKGDDAIQWAIDYLKGSRG
ncbi:MAG: S41 family peptidase [Chloroflexi bacterium]|nr:S41 family peptidase [Chloroflexota bacterium]